MNVRGPSLAGQPVRPSRPTPGHAAVWRAAALIAMVLVTVALLAAPAAAHSELEAAVPTAGESVPQAPGAVVLRFTEAVDPARSAITITDSMGSDASRGPTAMVPGDPRALRRPLGLLRPGQYSVDWTSVSRDDGHTTAGSYSFAIGTATASAEHVRLGALTAEGPLGLTGQLFVFAGLVLWVGACVLRRPVVRAGVPPSRTGAIRRVAAMSALTGSILVLAASAVSSSTAGLVAGRVGELRLVVLGASALGALAARRGRLVFGAAAGVALIAEAASGHLATQSLVVGTALVSVHLLAAGVWLFTITASLASRRVVRTLARLSPYAVGAAISVGLTGVVSAAVEVSTPSELVGTSYGRIVIAKFAALGLIAGAGAWQWHRRAVGDRPARVRQPVRLEAILAVGALALATVLSATAPPAPPVGAGTVTAVGSPLAGFPRNGPVSVAQASGPFVVALTVLPPDARPVKARVEVVGATSADQLGRVDVGGSVAGRRVFDVTFGPSGADTFDGRIPVDRNDTWTFDVRLTSARGSADVAFVLTLPAASGADELARALQAEDRLGSAQLHETLRSATDGPVITANYRFHAPDAISFTTPGSQEIDIGTRSFRRDQPSDPWMEQASSVGFRWPDPYFRDFWGPATVPRIIGSGVVDGVPSRIIAFVRPDLPAWFRLWVGISDGLVRREEMRAESHLMDHTYTNLNTALAVQPPA